MCGQHVGLEGQGSRWGLECQGRGVGLGERSRAWSNALATSEAFGVLNKPQNPRTILLEGLMCLGSDWVGSRPQPGPGRESFRYFQAKLSGSRCRNVSCFGFGVSSAPSVQLWSLGLLQCLGSDPHSFLRRGWTGTKVPLQLRRLRMAVSVAVVLSESFFFFFCSFSTQWHV